ncbi:MAG: ribbon-helix-helix domain-containing protein [Candidatus Obscuribacterales bacterium]|nr:ribbon-helix-helix domain-containing protein [Candidatus Obscuribacterales bacterium]
MSKKKRNFAPVTVGITFPDVYRLNEIARAEGRSRGDVIRHAVSKFISAYDGSSPLAFRQKPMNLADGANFQQMASWNVPTKI